MSKVKEYATEHGINPMGIKGQRWFSYLCREKSKQIIREEKKKRFDELNNNFGRKPNEKG